MLSVGSRGKNKTAMLAMLLVVLALGVAIHMSGFRVTSVSSDIHSTYLEGQHILAGVNPYTRILHANMQENDKYATYFPLFYYIAAAMQALGLHDFLVWLAALRWVLLPFQAGVGVVIYLMLYDRKGLWFAAFGALVFYLCRWNLYIELFNDMDSMAIFCLLLSLCMLKRHRRSSLLWLSVSLALKHFGLFVVPLYLIEIGRHTNTQRWKAVAQAALIIASVPFLLCLPFVFWRHATVLTNVEGLVCSIFFSATRNAITHVGVASIDELWRLSGFIARLPLFALFTLVYIIFARRALSMWAACFLIMALLIDFNPVLFLQYFVWVVPFALLAAADTQWRPAA